MSAAPRQPTIPLGAVALISASTLAYEVLLTRIFAIVHWHHLVATVISLGLLGYGASGTFLALFGQRLQRHLAAAFVANALVFAVTTVACTRIAQVLPFDPQALAWDGDQILLLAATFSLLAVPFFAAANCIGLVFSAFRDQIPKIYGMDLMGAGLGTVALALALIVLHPTQVLGAISIMGLAVAVLASLQLVWRPRLVATLAATLVVAIQWFDPATIRPAAYKDMARAMTVTGAFIDYERSGITGVLNVIENRKVPARHAPALSLHSMVQPAHQLDVFVDGNSHGVISDFSDVSKGRAFLTNLLSALPYTLLDRPEVAVLRAGTGLHVQQALTMGARAVSAVEANPLLHDASCTRYAALAGTQCDPAVTNWVVQTPRGFVANQTGRYDLITLKADSDIGGLNALDIDFALTREAFLSYLALLQPDGLLAIEGTTRLPPGTSVHLTRTAQAALRERGVTDPPRQLAVLRGWQRFLLLVAERPLNEQQVGRIRNFADDGGFDLVWLPGMRPGEANRYQVLQTAQYHDAIRQLFAAAAGSGDHNAALPSDDRPFPYRHTDWPTLWRTLRHGTAEQRTHLDSALLVATLTVAIAIVFSVLLIVIPLFAQPRTARPQGRRPVSRLRILIYFAAIGLAFLFIELAWIQRLELFLGHPLYATTIVLSAFLLFAGAGSAWAQKTQATSSARVLAASTGVILLFGLGYVLFLPGLLGAVSFLPLAIRIVITIALVGPLAFAMGMPFSIGLRRLGGITPALIPWAWGINGCASVISAAGAPLVALELGFSGLLLIALLAYLMAALAYPRNPPASSH